MLPAWPTTGAQLLAQVLDKLGAQMPDSQKQTRSQRYRDVLDYEVGARIVVEFTSRGREIVDYAVVLTVDDEHGEAVTVRVYDGAHGVNDMHRHDRAGEKAPAESFHA
ncbi:MAG: hypothetical protein WAU69_15115, partial [Solirubrobacteraceae bacterium]